MGIDKGKTEVVFFLVAFIRMITLCVKIVQQYRGGSMKQDMDCHVLNRSVM